MWQKLRPRLGRLALVLVVVSLVAGILFGKDLGRIWGAFVLERHVGEFLTEPEVPEGKPVPRIIGKVVPIDVNRRTLADLYHDLPPEIRAESVEDVGTVVWLDWKQNRTGDEGQFVVHTCQVTVIDRARNEVVGKAVFRMSGTADRKPSTQGIVQFLAGLKRYPRAK